MSDFILSGKCACIRLWGKGLGGGGTSPNFRYGGLACDKKWTQSDLKFCKNEGSIRSKTNEKGGQLDWKLRWKLMQNGEN